MQDMSRIGYAPGAFDLFHIGYLHLLRQARSRGDFLIACGSSLITPLQYRAKVPFAPHDPLRTFTRAGRMPSQMPDEVFDLVEMFATFGSDRRPDAM